MYEKQKNPQSRAGKFKTLALALLLGPVASFSTSAEYQLFDLGIDVTPTDINNLGTVVGARKTDTGTIAFRQLSGGNAVDIPDTTVANAVNEADQVTGNTLTGAFLFNNSVHEWGGYGGYGINEAGQIAGYKQLKNPYRAAPLPLDPAIYTPNQWANLGVARTYSRGTRQGVYADLYVLADINDIGYAVGTRRKYGISNGNFAFMTTPAFDSVTALPIPYGGAAAAINNQNMVVGTTGTNSSAGEYAHAYLYKYNANSTNSLLDLGTLNGGLTSGAYDINESNQVVGTSWLVTQLTSLYEPEKYHAFIWDELNGMVDLNTYLPAGSGWILTTATAINDNGDIVGSGLMGGQVHGFLLTTDQITNPPPEPNQPPVAIADSNAKSGKVPLEVMFSADGSFDPDGSIAAYQWNFGDGSTLSSDVNPSHTYTVPGSYTAILAVTDSQGLTDMAQVEITARKSRGRK
jgi:probable HAF family extracellular repeat protein